MSSYPGPLEHVTGERDGQALAFFDALTVAQKRQCLNIVECYGWSVLTWLAGGLPDRPALLTAACVIAARESTHDTKKGKA